jgi:glutamate-1-semialdehyde 2,1-aminomutase
MEREKSWEKITQIGGKIIEGWDLVAKKNCLDVKISGLPAMPSINFIGPDALAYKTLMTQEMLAKGYLASNLIYVCLAHTNDIIDEYFAALDPVFALIRECEDGSSVLDKLKGPVCHSGFKRLN